MLTLPRAALAGAAGAVIVAAATVLLVRGGGESTERASASAARPYAERSVIPSTVPRVTPADYRAPLRAYRRHVRAALARMLVDVAGLRTAIARDDLPGAKAAWLGAFAEYGTIGAAYGAFGALDRAIDGLPDGLPGGVDSARFTGLHRIELALWDRRSTAAASEPASRLARDVARLRTRVATLDIDPLEYSLRAHEILEDSLHLELSGRASPWSGAALVALRANVRGTQVVLRTLRRLVLRRDPDRRLPQADRALRRLARALDDLAHAHGGLPRWRSLATRDAERIAALTAGAAEQLAYIPELIDPRPPRPAQRAFG
jgi:iron uptake system component EfeO